MSNDNNITIVRGRHDRENPYFVSARAAPQDERLSWEARGVLWYLLSKPDNWRVQVSDLMQNCGRDKAKRIIKELRDAGYLRRESDKPRQDEHGKFVWEPYQVYEQPLTEKPSTVEPSTVNPSIYKVKKTDLENTEKEIGASAQAPMPDSTKKPVSNTKPATIPAERMNPMKNALALHFKLVPPDNPNDWSRIPQSKKGSILKAAKELCAVEAAVEDIPKVASWIRERWGEKAVTVNSIAKYHADWKAAQTQPDAGGQVFSAPAVPPEPEIQRSDVRAAVRAAREAMQNHDG
jgi:hypothetical protein